MKSSGGSIVLGPGVSGFEIGERVGVPWLGHTCQSCGPCVGGHENLCDHPEFTGFTRDGGYATMTIADARFAFPLGEAGEDSALAPLLCAGLIGWRAFKIAGRSAGRIERLGLYGFGAAAHILAQVAVRQGHRVFAFTQPGDVATQDFARKLGADWAGGSDEAPPEKLDAAIIFAPVGALVPTALRAVRKGGAVVCAGIHMSDIPSFPYSILWEERQLVSVANLTRRDGVEFLRLAPQLGIEDHHQDLSARGRQCGACRSARGRLRRRGRARSLKPERPMARKKTAIDAKDFRVKEDAEVDLADWPTRIDPVYRSKDDYHALLADHVARLSDLQQKLYAHNRDSLLLIFQAMDAAGKDGAIRHVMSGVNPQGCQVSSFKHPSGVELEHDFLWRTTRELPAARHDRDFQPLLLRERPHPARPSRTAERRGLRPRQGGRRVLARALSLDQRPRAPSRPPTMSTC